MIRIHLNAIQDSPLGDSFVSEVLSVSTRSGDILSIDARAYERIRAQHASPRLGDRLHAVLGPIGTALHWPCIDPSSPIPHALKPGSPCDQLRALANKIP